MLQSEVGGELLVSSKLKPAGSYLLGDLLS